MLILKYNRFRGTAKGREGSHRIFEIKYLGVAVVLIVHIAQVRIGIQHGLLGFHTAILSQFTGHADPGTLMERRKLHLGIGNDLPGALSEGIPR